MSANNTERKPSIKNHPEALALELTCPMCLQLFSDPVSLPCGHIFCHACIQTMEEGLDQHSCPECQEMYQASVKCFRMCSIIETYKATAGNANPAACQGAIKSEAGPVMNESDATYLQDTATAGESQEGSSGYPGKGFQIEEASTQDPHSIEQERGSIKQKAELEEPKFHLASQVTELNLKLEMADSLLRKEMELEAEVTAANARQRREASALLKQIQDLSQSYSVQVMQLMDEELSPGEASISSRVSQASELTKQLRQAMLRAESLLTEGEEAAFTDELRSLAPLIMELMEKSVEEQEDHVESKMNSARACPKLEQMSADLRERLGAIQRSLRNTFNPSEVTFDPETAHPNLILSADLKTVTFSATKQPYPPSPQRFTSFFQVLSTQSFHEGDHRWEVELEGSPWIVGMCYSGKLERSGIPSALESSRSSWCLMWFNNLLTAFERGHDVPLKKTTVSRRLEIRLSFKTHRLSFYNISPSSGKTHIYTFKAELTEPVHLAYRMMSGHPKARATVYS